jgi:cyclomaltodextrinase / maltogenic alpha-amylase / neopullulanase
MTMRYISRMPELTAPPVADFTPRWARHAIWYQILPERFRNGDPSNDPTAESLVGSHAGRLHPAWQIHPWTSDWYELAPYERAQGGRFADHVFRRRYGGDLQGVLDKLDYLQELGITAIYLTPVFDSPSLHKYDGSSYHHVDPHFGPDPQGDRALIAAETPGDPSTWPWTSADRLLLALVAEVHRRGMRIILDGVFNHMGARSWAFLDVVKHQRASRTADWFKVSAWDDAAAGTKLTYEGWAGHLSLPELRQDEDGIVAGPRDYIFAATRRWMAPDGVVENGIDGWRLDVASWVRHGFWKKWRALVKSINPEAYLTGEIIDTVAVIEPYLQGDEFDAVMNYPFAHASHEFFFAEGGAEGRAGGAGARGAATALVRRLEEQHAAFPACVVPVMQNLFGSHDTARVASHAVNGARLSYGDFAIYAIAARADHPSFDTRAPTEEERRRQRLFVLFQMTALGAPMIYYGDEAGMWGATDPCCRKPMVWPELTYAAEATLPSGEARGRADPVAFDAACFAHYQRLIALRQRTPALREGTMRWLLADDARGLLVFLRETKDQRVIVALNRSGEPQRVRLAVAGAAQFRDAVDEGLALTAVAAPPAEKNSSSSSIEELEWVVPARWGTVVEGPGIL